METFVQQEVEHGRLTGQAQGRTQQAVDEKRYYDAAKLLVKIEDVEGIELALEDLTRNWMWKLKDVNDETWSYAYFLDGFCNEFRAYDWREKNLHLAVDAYEKADELGNQYAALRLADC